MHNVFSPLSPRHSVLRSKDMYLDLDTPCVMGVINLSPESFFEDSIVRKEQLFRDRIENMIAQGARLIDIGASSSRPGSPSSSAAQEIERIKPLVEPLAAYDGDIIFSIDTVHAQVAEYCLQNGFGMVNDISGGQKDPDMVPLAVDYNVPFVCMHMKGQPENMQENPMYEDVTKEVLDFFIERFRFFHSQGLYEVILDPGIGFGKTIQHNFQLIAELDAFQIFDQPLLVGVSRKSFIYKILKTTPKEALNGTTAIHMAALLGGAKILRVHDVAPAMEVVKLYEEIKKYGDSSKFLSRK